MIVKTFRYRFGFSESKLSQMIKGLQESAVKIAPEVKSKLDTKYGAMG